MSTTPNRGEQPSRQHEFGGPFDAFLGAAAIGAPTAGECVANSTVKWVLAGVGAIAGTILMTRALAAEDTSGTKTPIHLLDRSGQL